MHSVKKDVVLTLALSTDTDALKRNQIIAVTAAGLVYGRIPESKGTEKNAAGTELISALLSKISNKHSKESVQGNDGYLQLVDVTICSSNGMESHLSDLVLFYDQIIGITIGQKN